MGKPLSAVIIGIALILVCAAVSFADAEVVIYRLNNFDHAQIGAGHDFAYESVAISPGRDPKTGMIYTEWFYDYFLENLSTELTILGWTCADPFTSEVLQGLPPLGPVVDLIPTWGEDSFDHPSGPVVMSSTILWSDGHRSYVDIYSVPEPGGAAACVVGCSGLMGFLRRRR